MVVTSDLIIRGSADEVKIVEKFNNYFKVTFSREQIFKKIKYTFAFLKPNPDFRQKFNLANEILIIFDDYRFFSNKLLDFVDKTVILGKTILPFAYIMRELAYQQGQVWNQEKLKQSFLRLKELDIFESIQLYPARTQKLEREKF